jgi:N-dimethylarginine dimethylaminohydrolase
MPSVYNTFDPVKEIILGDVDPNAIKIDDERKQKRIEFIFEKTKEELTVFQELLEARGIKVHRPTAFPNVPIHTPYWSSHGTRIPLTPRDLFFVLGDTLIESAMCEQERLFETFYFRDIILQHFHKGSKWISMPMPRHDYRSVPNDDTVPNLDPIMDAPSCLQYGKDVFVNIRGAGNTLGHSWLERTFGDKYTFHLIDQDNIIGHLDSQMAILRPGLLYTYHTRDMLPSFFKDWDIINFDPTEDKATSAKQELIDTRIQDSDFENTVLGINCLSLDRNTVVMWEHYKHNKQITAQFEKHGIEIIFVPFTYSHFYNQGVTCLTLELERHTPEGPVRY